MSLLYDISLHMCAKVSYFTHLVIIGCHQREIFSNAARCFVAGCHWNLVEILMILGHRETYTFQIYMKLSSNSWFVVVDQNILGTNFFVTFSPNVWLSMVDISQAMMTQMSTIVLSSPSSSRKNARKQCRSRIGVRDQLRPIRLSHEEEINLLFVRSQNHRNNHIGFAKKMRAAHRKIQSNTITLRNFRALSARHVSFPHYFRMSSSPSSFSRVSRSLNLHSLLSHFFV